MTPRTAAVPFATPAPPSLQPERRLCASPSCCNSYVGSGEGDGLCESCALELDLFDREARWQRVFPTGSSGPFVRA